MLVWCLLQTEIQQNGDIFEGTSQLEANLEATVRLHQLEQHPWKEEVMKNLQPIYSILNDEGDILVDDPNMRLPSCGTDSRPSSLASHQTAARPRDAGVDRLAAEIDAHDLDKSDDKSLVQSFDHLWFKLLKENKFDAFYRQKSSKMGTFSKAHLNLKPI